MYCTWCLWQCLESMNVTFDQTSWFEIVAAFLQQPVNESKYLVCRYLQIHCTLCLWQYWDLQMQYFDKAWWFETVVAFIDLEHFVLHSTVHAHYNGQFMWWLGCIVQQRCKLYVDALVASSVCTIFAWEQFWKILVMRAVSWAIYLVMCLLQFGMTITLSMSTWW